MKSEIKEQLRHQLLNQCKTEPDQVVDWLLELKEEVELFKSRLNKNSSNSSRPPSSDQNKPKKTTSLRKNTGRKTGGQPGHCGKTLEQVSNPDHKIEYKLDVCPITGRKLTEADIIDVIVRQVFDLPEPKLEVTEHLIYVYAIAGSSQRVHSPFPENVNAPAQYGKRYESGLVHLKNQCLLSFEAISQLSQDIYGYSVSEATILKALETNYNNLEEFDTSVRIKLGAENSLHADESGFRIEKQRHWLHVLCSENYTLYGVSSSRGMAAIEQMGVLQTYNGHLMHDCWGTYFNLSECTHGLCNPHLLRELKYFHENENQPWAKNMEDYIWDAYKNGNKKSKQGWQCGFTRIVNEGYRANPFEPLLIPGKRGPKKQPPVIKLLDRLWNYADYYLSFLKDPEFPFSNNLAEQDIRMLKVQQKISGCFRTWKGAQRFARTRSYISTARKQGVNVFEAILQAQLGNPLFV